MAKIPKAVADYYSAQSGVHKETLMEMRNRILEIIPGATEIIKYSMPTFVHEGNEVAGLLANKNHIGYYPYSGSVISQFPDIEEKYTTSKGALHVPLGKALSKSDLKKLIRARISMCEVASEDVDMSKYEEKDEEWRTIGLAAPARRARPPRRPLLGAAPVCPRLDGRVRADLRHRRDHKQIMSHEQ